MAFDVDKNGKQRSPTADAHALGRELAAVLHDAAGTAPSTSARSVPRETARSSWGAPFGLGIGVGVVLSLGVGLLIWPAAPTRPAPDVEPTVALAAAEPARAPEPTPAAPEAAAAPTEPGAAAPSEPTPPPTAAAAEPVAAAAVPGVTALAARGTDNRGLETAARVKAVAAPPTPAPSNTPPPTAAVAAIAPVAKAPAEPAPKPDSPPVDPDSQDAKLAAAAQVKHSAGTPIDSMLDQAFAPKAHSDSPKLAPAETVLVTPQRDDVIKAMSVLVPAIRGCAQGASGLATVTMVVRNDGHVESAALSGAPFEGTASGRCMEGVVRRARFPRFKQASFRVQFPFAVQ